MIKIAIDVHVSRRLENKLKFRHTIVRRAEPGEEDAVWVEDALQKGANVFISADLDIANLLEPERGVYWVEYPPNKRAHMNIDKIINYRLNLVRAHLNATWNLQFLTGPFFKPRE